jgi:hypothetical protein
MFYVPLDPDGNPAATTSDPAKLRRGRYDCALLDYWTDQARQMASAGLDWVAIDSFGDRKDLEVADAIHNPTQDRYLVPAAWLKPGQPNELTVFDEHGASPSKVKLAH